MAPPITWLPMFLLLVAIYVVSLVSFGRGFFLTRLELRRTSRHDDLSRTFLASSPVQPSGAADVLSAVTDGSAPFSRALLVIIDAWRYDFAQWNHALDASLCETATHKAGWPAPCYYQNRMPRLRQLLASHPRHARLFRAVADAPTVTMQRLKGLTSGSLPTFIDAASNFDTSTGPAASGITGVAVGEDTIVGQAAAREAQTGRILAFLGDDTWCSLFPGTFNVSHCFPSFNVADLHGVDKGINDHIADVIASGWGLLVAHYLGVDHVGHTHGPSHVEMARKLGEMDESIDRIRRLLAAADAASHERSVMVVMGDHGMSSGGNHGGASEEETAAALVMVDVGAVAAADKGVVGGLDAQDALFPQSSLEAPQSTISGGGDEAAGGDDDHNAPSSVSDLWFSDADWSCDGSEANSLIPNDEDQPSRLFPLHTTSIAPASISQIDVVPTLSLLLGLPIPFANLGRVMPQVNYYSGRASSDHKATKSDAGAALTSLRSLRVRLSAYRSHALNAWQVHRYLHAYNGAASAAASAAVPVDADTDAPPLPSVDSGSSSSSSGNSGGSAFPAHLLSRLQRRYVTGMRAYKKLLCEIETTLGATGIGVEGGQNSGMRDADDAVEVGSPHPHLRQGHIEGATSRQRKRLSPYARVVQALQSAEESILPGGDSALSSSLDHLHSRARLYRQSILTALTYFLDQSSSMCRRLWTRFDVAAMAWGLLSMAVGTILTLALALVLAQRPRVVTSSGLLSIAARACARAVTVAIPLLLLSQPRRTLLSLLSFARLGCNSIRPLIAVGGACEAIEDWAEAVQGASWSSVVPLSLLSALGFLQPYVTGLWNTLDAAAAAIGTSLPPRSELLTAVSSPPLPVAMALVAAWSIGSDVNVLLTLTSAPAKRRVKTPASPASYNDIPCCPSLILCCLSLCLFALRLWALTTNSFIIAEPRVIGWLLQGATVLAALVAIRGPDRSPSADHDDDSSGKVKARAHVNPYYSINLGGALFVSLLCCRLTEQSLGPLAFPVSWAADPMMQAQGRGQASDGAGTTITKPGVVITLVGSLAIPFALLLWGRLCSGNLWRGQKRNVVFALLPAAACGIGLAGCVAHWLLRGGMEWPDLPQSHLSAFVAATPDSLRLLLPRAVYALGAAQVALTVVSHLICRLLWGHRFSPSSSRSLPLHLLASALPTLVMLLGPRSPPVILAMVVHTACISQLSEGVIARYCVTTSLPEHQSPPPGLLPCVLCSLFTGPWALLALLWGLLPAHYYLAVGHGNVFSSLDFYAPFNGYDDFSFWRSGAMMIGNIYAAHIVIAALGGALFLQQMASLPTTTSSSYSSHRVDSSRLQCEANANIGNNARLLSAALLLLALPACVSFVTSSFCLFARRHLMVWAIFAPKWVFDTAAYAVSVACALAAMAVASI